MYRKILLLYFQNAIIYHLKKQKLRNNSKIIDGIAF